jgi:hypothetical protein
LISSWFITEKYLRLEHEILNGEHDPFRVNGELFLVGGDQGVEPFEALGLGDGVAFSEGLDQKFIVGGVEVVGKRAHL